MEADLDLVKIEPAKHLPREVIDQLLIDKNAFRGPLGGNQAGQHGAVARGTVNETTLAKVEQWGVAIKVNTERSKTLTRVDCV